MTQRVFIALNLPAEQKKTLRELIKELQKINPSPSIKYVPAENLHLTLHFLGDLTLEQIEAVKKVLDQTVKNYPADQLLTGAINGFPNLRQPRVIFLETKPAEKNNLINLQENLGQKLQGLGLETERRPWQAHLTLARIKGPVDFKTTDLKPLALKIPIRNVELMVSHLQSSGPKHTVLSQYQQTYA